MQSKGQVMQVEFVFSGFGGQGVMLAGQLLAQAVMDSGMEVTWIPSYGPEMRGGTAHCTVIVSDSVIGSPVVRQPQIALVFNNPSLEKYEPLVKTGGWLIYNSSLVAQQSTRQDIHTLAVPATEIAESAGNIKLMNVVMLGAALVINPMVPLAFIQSALREKFSGDLLDVNILALEQGVTFANEHQNS